MLKSTQPRTHFTFALNKHKFVLTAVTVLTFAGNAHAQTPTFATPVEYAMGQDSQEFTVGDFNADGNLDVVTVSFYDETLYLRLGNGDGTFQGATSLTDLGYPNDVASADINGDGKLDLVSTRTGNDHAVVRLGNGDGTFQAPVTYTVGDGPYFLTLVDLNANSVLDLVTSNFLSDDISVLLGNGDGTFGTATTYTGPAFASSVRAILSDNSGLTDLAVAGSGSNVLSIFPANGDGTFGAKIDYATGAAPYGLAKGDLNGDGFDDIVVPNSGGTTLSLFLAKGDGTYEPAESVTAGDTPTAAVIADLNSDGNPDVAVTNTDDNTVQIFTGDGMGAIASAATLTAGPITVSVYIKAVDLNNDGRLDLIVSKWGAASQGAIDVYLNTTPAAEIDVKGNGVSIADGSTTPSKTDNTDFDGALSGSGSVVKSFQIENSGAYALSLLGTPAVTISGANAGDFSVEGQPSSPIGLNAASVFNIRFTPTALGLRTATVTIENTDPNESNYSFAIQGTGGTAPQTRIRRQPAKTFKANGRKTKKRLSFYFTSSLPGATFLCKLNNQAYTSCESPKKYSLNPGDYTFRVKAVVNGITDRSAAVHRFKVKR